MIETGSLMWLVSVNPYRTIAPRGTGQSRAPAR